MKTDNKPSEKLYTVLREIGLSHNASELYMVALKCSDVSITDLAKILSLSRPSVYASIKELQTADLITISDDKNITSNFSVVSPSAVLEKLRKRKADIESVESSFVAEIPDLLSQYHQGNSLSKIKVLQGKEEYLKLFNQSLEEAKSEIKFFGSADEFIEFISWDSEKEWIKKRIKNGIFFKALLLPGEDASTLKKNDSIELRETRIFVGEKRFSTSFMIFADTLVFWQPKAPLAIVIEDSYVRETMNVVFEELWDKAEDSQKLNSVAKE